ncbi:hypothetical protein LX32DRAFT_425663 [Colletotrichum zoysiae]|uniref:Uncharacterized protein n=1 Tax=Colletotrichum zoysiae TaxID=1216348 RepID=A0AAD9M0C9_9PEZI|nr:hypothetical protein LX32DRAFT_425663 [Colletotrichum zoysiae]
MVPWFWVLFPSSSLFLSLCLSLPVPSVTDSSEYLPKVYVGTYFVHTPYIALVLCMGAPVTGYLLGAPYF